MDILIMFVVLSLILFILSYLTKRRFGVLGLALAAGAMLSELWARKLIPIVKDLGFDSISPPLSIILSVGLIVLPALILLISGPSYKGKIQRLVGSIMFTLLALSLMIEPIGNNIFLQNEQKDIYLFLLENRVFIVTIGLVYAVIDLLITRTNRYRH